MKSRIPGTNCDKNVVQSVFLKALETKRSEIASTVKHSIKKMDVPAGKSVCPDDQDNDKPNMSEDRLL